jgi:methoxymalonate biosynthesis acyl carrier protein
MTDRAFFDDIIRIFYERLNLSIPSYDADLFETGIMDSLTFVDLIVNLEQQFDIHIAADELELDDFRSVAKIAGFVAARGTMKRVGAA